jgi:hypothetical protein
MWGSIRAWLGKSDLPLEETESAPTKSPRKRKTAEKPQSEPELTPKDQATVAGRPYVNVLGMDYDPANPTVGSFELDWNELFIKQLLMAGYRGESDEQIVDQWFQDICRNVIMETYEQDQADPSNRVNRRDLGDGRYEAS